MKLLVLPTLICEECGVKLVPKMDTLQGAARVRNGLASYWHLGNSRCSHSEEVCRVPLSALDAEVVGRMDWRTLPAKMKAVTK